MDANAYNDIVRNDIEAVLPVSEIAEITPQEMRPWPPVMIRDLERAYTNTTREVDASAAIGDIADFLTASPGASIALYKNDGTYLGVAVDDDVMALIKRDGVRALDYPIVEAVQRNRPVCSVTDSPYVILQLMRSEGWDRVGIAEHGRVTGILHRRDLVKFVGA